MNKNLLNLGAAVLLLAAAGCQSARMKTSGDATVILPSTHLAKGKGALPGVLKLDGLFYETGKGRVVVKGLVFNGITPGETMNGSVRLSDGHMVKITIVPDGGNYTVQLSAEPSADIIRWGFSVEAA